MEETCEDHRTHVCDCSSKPSLYTQSLTEMDFERGIWQAALDNNVKRITTILDKGGDPDARDGSGYTALHYASRSGHKDACSLLLERGADVNAQTRSGRASSLHRAAYSGHVTVVKLLIKYGADPRLSDSDGQTPLHKAAQKAHKEAVELLLDLDSSLVKVKDKNGRKPADLVPSHEEELRDMLKAE